MKKLPKGQTAAHPKIGDNAPDDQMVFTLLLDEWFKGLIKKTNCKGGCAGTIDSTINAFSYFITSGEAVKKAEQLDKDAWEFAGKCRKLLRALKKARGESMYLEVTYEEGVLVCRKKDPRKAKEEE